MTLAALLANVRHHTTADTLDLLDAVSRSLPAGVTLTVPVFRFNLPLTLCTVTNFGVLEVPNMTRIACTADALLAAVQAGVTATLPAGR